MNKPRVRYNQRTGWFYPQAGVYPEWLWKTMCIYCDRLNGLA